MARKSPIKLKSLTISQQAMGLLALYPDASCTTGRNRLTWRGNLRPSPVSPEYDVEVKYSFKKTPQCFVITPLETPSKKRLPHVYNQADQKLCLYYPGTWNSSMSIALTIVPWASEWLFYYELWLTTGKWLGGGVHTSAQKTESQNK